jgi:hypothetical protein
MDGTKSVTNRPIDGLTIDGLNSGETIMQATTPISGQWYARKDTGQKFEVISVDGGVIEIQDYEGALDEMEMDDWMAEEFDLSDPPEDLGGVFDLAPPDEADGGDPVELDGASTLQRAEQDSWQRSEFENDDNWGTAPISDQPPSQRLRQ